MVWELKHELYKFLVAHGAYEYETSVQGVFKFLGWCVVLK